MSYPWRPLVLCLDDDPIALRMRTALLESAGYTVLPATEPEEALNIFKDRPVNMVVSDHVLKSAKGTEVAGEMKKVKPAVPIVLLSGSVPDSLSNVDCFILKSEPSTVILGMISDLLQRSAA